MLKHKIKAEPVFKHKREPFPCELHPPGSTRSKKRPEGFNEREYRAHLDADAFTWMLYWASNPDHKFDLDEMINYWWKRAYNKPFPNEGGIAADLVDRIYCRLIDRGHEFQRIEPQESDYELPEPLLRSEYWKKVKGRKIVYIQQTMEAKMAKISQKKSAKTDVKSTGAPPKVSKTANKAASSNDVPAWITSSRPGTKAHDSKIKVCELLLERKYSDEEIALMVESELEYKINPDRVAFYRRTLNKGQFAPLGYEAPDEPVQPIEKDGSAPAKSAKPAKAIKAPKESAAKPSTAKVKGACMVSKKKKVVIKKK